MIFACDQIDAWIPLTAHTVLFHRETVVFYRQFATPTLRSLRRRHIQPNSSNNDENTYRFVQTKDHIDGMYTIQSIRSVPGGCCNFRIFTLWSWLTMRDDWEWVNGILYSYVFIGHSEICVFLTRKRVSMGRYKLLTHAGVTTPVVRKEWHSWH